MDILQFEISRLTASAALNFAHQINSADIRENVEFSANLKWVEPFGALLTSIAIKQLRDKYKDIPFNFQNHATEAGSYAAHIGFFKSISDKIKIGNEPGEAKGNENYIPITVLDLSQVQMECSSDGRILEIGNAIEIKSVSLAKILCRDSEEMVSLMTYLIREIIRNVPEHADTMTAWICGQYWPHKQQAEIAIVDEGIGIRKSLRKNHTHSTYIQTDEEAILCAVKPGISQAFVPSRQNRSTDIWANSGFGLYMVSEICRKLKGLFLLASGEKFLCIKSSGDPIIGDTYLSGTAIRMIFSTQDLKSSKEVIQEIASLGELQARTIRNAFKKASTPSKGLVLGDEK